METRIWISQGTNFLFPEREPGILPDTSDSAICFSGGGMRALTATMGQLRGLDRIEVMSRIRYLSSVSGGARAAIVYTYYRRGATDDAQLLGPITRPEDITLCSLSDLNPGNLGVLATKDPTQTMFLLSNQGVPSDQLWAQAAGLNYLASFGLYDPYDSAYFSLDERSIGAIKRRNPELAGATFYPVRTGVSRPYLVVQAVFVVPTALSPYRQAPLVNLEFTPLYGGSPYSMDVRYEALSGEQRTINIGGGYIEPIALGSDAPATAPRQGLVRVEAPARQLTLADVSGTATASYSALNNNFLGAFSPQWPYWPVREGGIAETIAFNFGDGGNLEDYGLISMLRRKVSRIAVFINTDTELNLDYDPSTPPTFEDIDPNLPPLFGYPNVYLPSNQVFARSEFAPLVRALQAAKRSGRTVMATTELESLDNEWWGLRAGHRATICWVYNDRVADWERLIPSETGIPAAIEAGNGPQPCGPFRYFPHYRVTGQNSPGSLALTPQQVNLLADLSCWNIVENAASFHSLFEA